MLFSEGKNIRGVLHFELPICTPETHYGDGFPVDATHGNFLHEAIRFTRADLIFGGVDHSQFSYEVRVFIDNPAATAVTPKSADEGYAGRFVVFGHGGCYGDEGHCTVPTIQPTWDLRKPHSLVGQTFIVTITKQVRVAFEARQDSVLVCLVPLNSSKEKISMDCRFVSIDLELYRDSDFGGAG